MRSSGWLALCVALWAAAAVAEPVIVDPDGPDGPMDWKLALEQIAPGGTFSNPSAMVFVGSKADEEMLVLEKNTGRVRHFKNRTDQGDALDLGVDSCGDRGLIGIALHPEFDRSTPTETDPAAPQKDWVYLSYHAGSDGCGGSTAHFRVERYVWNGTQLTLDTGTYPATDDDFEPFTVFDRIVDASSEVGGVIATTRELIFQPQIAFATVLYIAIGAQTHRGSLQNNQAVPFALDDTSVLIRLDQNGGTPKDNPLNDPDTPDPEPIDLYSGYGIRDPRSIATDPVSGTLFFSEHSDPDKPDEINLFLPATNGGYSFYQGCPPGLRCSDPIPANIKSGAPNPDYHLVDLAFTNENDPADEEPISTYLNPRFSFEDGTIDPTGVAFGGTEVGPQHREDLFVGSEDGRVFRFPVEPLRSGFLLTDVLADTIAQKAVPDDPGTVDVDESRPADDLKQILIATGFGAIADLETGIDGSMYVLDRTNGSIQRMFFNAERDLAVLSVKVPTKIALSAKKPTVRKRLKVNLVNHGEVPERIDDLDELNGLLGLTITPAAGSSCAPITTATAIEPWYGFPIGIAPGDKLPLQVDVEWACASPTPAGVADFETSLRLNAAAIGIVDPKPENDVCPRAPAGGDPGCGVKGGGPIVTDVTLK